MDSCRLVPTGEHSQLQQSLNEAQRQTQELQRQVTTKTAEVSRLHDNLMSNKVSSRESACRGQGRLLTTVYGL